MSLRIVAIVTFFAAFLLDYRGNPQAEQRSPEDGVSVDRPTILGVYEAGTLAQPGSTRVVIPAAAQAPRIWSVPKIIYMNRDGGTYTPGFNDARTNVSSVPDTTAVISAFGGSEQDWQEIMTAMQEIWAPFYVTVTDEDPGDVPHWESVVAGHPSNVGASDGTLGISPYTVDCGVIDNSIVYTFADYAQALGASNRRIAEIASQEVGHSFGGDHQMLASDPFTYLSFSGDRTFKNEDADCGEFEARDCGLPQFTPCSGLGTGSSTTTQNSFQLLTDRVGDAADFLDPGVDIYVPSTGSNVTANFTVRSLAAPSDGTDIASVTFEIDGEEYETLTAPPFDFTAPDGIFNGEHTVTVTVADSGGDSASDSITVTMTGVPGETDGNEDDPTGEAGELFPFCNGGGHSLPSLALVLAALVFVTRRRRGVTQR